MTDEEQKTYQKAYKKKNKEKIKEYNKEYRSKNKEKIKESTNKYYEKNKEKIKEHQREYYKQNKEKKKEYFKNNKERIKEYSKEYREKNREKKSIYDKEYWEKNRQTISDQYNQHMTERNNVSRKMAFNHYRKWTPEEDTILIKLKKQDKPQKEIAEILGRTISSINTRLVRLRNADPFNGVPHDDI